MYVKNQKTGKVNKVTFGDPNMKIRKNNPKARKSYLARSGGIKTSGQKPYQLTIGQERHGCKL